MAKQALPKREQFARENPEVYIGARPREGAGAHEEEFCEHGRAEAPSIFGRVEPFLRSRELVVEFG